MCLPHEDYPWDDVLLSIRARLDSHPSDPKQSPRTEGYRDACFDILEEISKLRGQVSDDT